MTICTECLRINALEKNDDSEPYGEGCIIVKCILKDGKHHSYNDDPAIIYKNNSKAWYKNGKEHRENGPAWVGGLGSYGVFYLDGEYIIDQENLYIGKVIQLRNFDYAWPDGTFKTGIIIEQINNTFWRFIIGDEKRVIAGI